MKFVSKSIENRIENLDFIRGVAILGILIMNSMIFALPESANWNHSSSGIDSYFDWILIFFAVIFIDGKMMGLFSILFGAGLLLFVDSAKKKGYKRPVMLSLWRNLLLLSFGILHIIFMFVFIDILFLYALLSPIILLLRNRSLYLLMVLFIIVISISTFSGIYFQGIFDSNGNLSEGAKDIFLDGKGLGPYWFSTQESFGGAIGSYTAIMYFTRVFSLMLLGVILYRLNILQGNLKIKTNNQILISSLLIGIPISMITPIWLSLENYNPGIAIVSYIPLYLGTYPMVIGYICLLTLIYKKISPKVSDLFKACGRMAFTNYITQSIFGALVFYFLFDSIEFTRKEIIIFVLVVWIIQIVWSKFWLNHYKQGPLEWFWRKLTYINGKN